MAISPITSNTAYNNTPSFKGGMPKAANFALKSPKQLYQSAKNGYNKAWDGFIDNVVIDNFLKPIMNTDSMLRFADKVGNSKKMASHMSTGGSFVTTAFYIRQTHKTLNKDEEQKKRAKTLELNQGLVTVVSTALGYGVNGLLDRASKNLGYKFRQANQNHPELSRRMNGFDIAKQLLIFSLMYRYVAPVFVTPVASKLSKWWEARKVEKAQNAQPAQIIQMQQPQNVAKEVSMKPQATAKSA